MRVLFIHISRDTSAEYGIHANFAADVDSVDGVFFWQRSATHNEGSATARPGQDHFFEFGRDLSLEPKPSRRQRAVLMARSAPVELVRLVRAARRIRPDVVYVCQHDYDLYVARLLSRILRVPYVIHVNYPVGPWLHWTVVRSIRRADHVIACSRFVSDTIVEIGRTPVPVLANPADIDAFRRGGDRDGVRTELGIDADASIVVSAGRLDPGKGHLTLIEAFGLLHDEFPSARALICGETFTRDGHDELLRTRVRELGLERTVTFAGQRRDLPAVFAASDIFCLPTVAEAFGLVFTEAMGAGLPVLACRSGGVPEIVVDGQTGLLSAPDDAPGLADNLRRMLRDPRWARSLGLAGQRRALEMFTPQALSPQWKGFLDGVVDRE